MLLDTSLVLKEVHTMNEKTMTAFLRTVKFAAKELGFDVFCAVEANGVGYVAYSNDGSKAILDLKKAAESFSGPIE